MVSRLTMSGAAAAAILMLGAALPVHAQDATQPTNNCAPGEKIDGTTANDARQKMEAAGFTDVTQLYKGCDNVWHGQARANGNPVNVMVGPDNVVRQEGS